MMLAIIITVVFISFVWLVFFKFKLLKWNIAWGIVSGWVGLHCVLIFLIGLRFMTPASEDTTVIQHTIQLIPRLTEPTLVTDVLVEPDTPVKKGQPLFRFDRRPYEFKVNQLAAQLAQAKQDVLVLQADVAVNEQKLAMTRSQQEYAQYQQKLSQGLAEQNAGSQEDVQKWKAQIGVAAAAVAEAEAELVRAKARFESQINGVNTNVVAVQAQLDLANYYLDNTTMVAPEDGRIINLQVRPGMVAGEVRFGAIASFICDDGRYILANYFRENLKYVKEGQPVEVAIELYPGQVFRGKVAGIWNASGEGQLLPSGTLPSFMPSPPTKPQGQYAVKIVMEGDQSRFPIGAKGAAAIYTTGMSGGWAAMRRITLRTTAWAYWLYPVPF